ncbi:hypothetical protein BH10ACT3_BH10ACT3_21500 [soil metagenome]
MSAIDARMMQRKNRARSSTQSGEDATAGASRPQSVTGSEQRSRGARLSLAQQRARAFIDLMAGRRAGATTTPGDAPLTGVAPPADADEPTIKVETEIIIHVRGDGNTFDDGTPIAGSLVDRLAPEAFFRMMIHDAERRPINASGLHRHPTTRQKRVVAERDGHVCTVDDCTATTFLEYDHVPDYDISGRTVVDELRLICSKDHRARHERE